MLLGVLLGVSTWFKRMLLRWPRVTQQGFPETQACVYISRNKSGMYLSNIVCLMGYGSVHTHWWQVDCPHSLHFDVEL